MRRLARAPRGLAAAAGCPLGLVERMPWAAEMVVAGRDGAGEALSDSRPMARTASTAGRSTEEAPVRTATGESPRRTASALVRHPAPAERILAAYLGRGAVAGSRVVLEQDAVVREVFLRDGCALGAVDHEISPWVVGACLLRRAIRGPCRAARTDRSGA